MKSLFPVAEVTRLLSNLYKSGFQNLSVKQGDTFLFDANKHKKNETPAGRVIRPVEEQKEEEEQPEGANSVILSDAMDKAKVLRDDAMVRAAKIISDAEEEAKQIAEQARQEGYEQGLKEGNMEAMKRADQYLSGIRKEQDALLQKNQEELQKQMEKAEHDMVDVTCDLIAKLTGILVSEYKPVMLYMINQALSNAETSKRFVIHVAEETYAYIADNHDRLVGAANPGIEIEIYGDSKMEKGACQIDTDNGIIDLSMDVQVKNLTTAIKLLSDS